MSKYVGIVEIMLEKKEKEKREGFVLLYIKIL